MPEGVCGFRTCVSGDGSLVSRDIGLMSGLSVFVVLVVEVRPWRLGRSD